jgi:phage-related protein
VHFFDQAETMSPFSIKKAEMILLHAFIEKTQQTNPTDIDLASKRLKEWKIGQIN